MRRRPFPKRLPAVAAALALVAFAALHVREDAIPARADAPADAPPAVPGALGLDPAQHAADAPVAGQGSTAWFQEVPGAIPSLKPIYDLYTQPLLVRVIPADLDADGLDDIVLHMYAFNIGGAANNDPCRNHLVVLMHKPGGTFADETATRIAGAPDLQACSSDFVVHDVNGDGRADVLFANSNEDGRDLGDSANAHALNAALVSQPDGRHAVERFGIAAWHYGIDLPRDGAGVPYVAISSYTHAPEFLRRDGNGTWSATEPGTSPTQANMTVFLRPDGGPGPSTQLIKNALYPDNFDLAGAVRDGQGVWHELPNLRLFEPAGMVKFVTWANVLTDTPVVRIGDEYAMGGTFHRGCPFRIAPGAPVSVVTKLQTGLMPVPYTGPDQVVVEGDLIHSNRVFRVQIVDGALQVAPLPIAGQRNRDVLAGLHACKDVNGDGYDDVVVYAETWTGAPLVYVNNRKGGLRYIGSAPFPVPAATWGFQQGTSVLHDFDHDGLLDYLSCPCNGWSSQFNNDVGYNFYKGIHPLPDTSVPGDPVDVQAEAGAGSARVWFSPPPDDGGLAITGYTVQSIPAGGVDAAAGTGATERVVTGLANGTSYRFVAVASNAKGEGNPSAQSNAVTPVAQLLSVGALDIVEGQSGTSLANFVVSLASPAAQAVTVSARTEQGSALAGADFTPTAEPALTIVAGQTSTIFSVPIAGDTVVEGDEAFWVVLENASGATLGTRRARGRIVNDDLAQLYVGDVSITEGNSGLRTVGFPVTLSEAMPTPVVFDIGTLPQGAIVGADFVARSQSARVIDAGRTSVLFEVTVVGDTLDEVDETFSAVVSNVQGAVVMRPLGTATILDDDASAAAPARRAGRQVPGAKQDPGGRGGRPAGR